MGSRPDVDNAVHPNPDAVFDALVTASAEVGANQAGAASPCMASS